MVFASSLNRAGNYTVKYWRGPSERSDVLDDVYYGSIVWDYLRCIPSVYRAYSVYKLTIAILSGFIYPWVS